MTCYALGVSVLKRYRIREHFRNYWNTWLRQMKTKIKQTKDKYLITSLDSGEEEDTQVEADQISMEVIDILELVAKPMGTECKGAFKRTITSPSTALSSTLHISMISLPSYSQTKQQEAKGLEVYVVMDGNGLVYQNEESAQVHSGKSFTINPYSTFCIVNKSRHELTYLRISDGGESYDNDEFDIASKIISSKKRRKTLDLLLDGLSKLSCSSL